MNSTDLLSAGLAALDSGDDREARRLFGNAVRQSPDDLDAWWHLSGVMIDPAQKAHCLRQVLRLQPDHVAAGELLRDAERRIASPTPAYGLARPVLDAAMESKPVEKRVQHAAGKKRTRAGRRIVLGIVAGVVLLAALVVISLVAVSGNGGDNSGLNPTLQSVRVGIGVPSCTTGEIKGTQLVFVNQSSMSVQLYRGELDHEDFLGSISPGQELSIEAASDVRVRYAVRTKEMATTEGAILEVPSNNSCRVPIIES